MNKKIDKHTKEDKLNSLLNQYATTHTYLQDCYKVKKESDNVINSEQLCNYMDAEIGCHRNTLEYIKNEILNL